MFQVKSGNNKVVKRFLEDKTGDYSASVGINTFYMKEIGIQDIGFLFISFV